jgi:hypothetical protein
VPIQPWSLPNVSSQSCRVDVARSSGTRRRRVNCQPPQ